MFYKGTSLAQDGRFVNPDKKIQSKLNYPEEFSHKISKNKINIPIIKQWISKKINDILSFDDELLTNLIVNLIEENENEFIDGKNIYYSIMGFLGDDTFNFCQELWKILIKGENSKNFIPIELIQEKKIEIEEEAKIKKNKMKFLEDLIKKEESLKENKIENDKSHHHHHHKHKNKDDSYKHHHHHDYYKYKDNKHKLSRSRSKNEKTK